MDNEPELSSDSRIDGDAQVAPLVSTLRSIDRLYAQALRQAAEVDGHRAVAEEGMTVDLAVRLHAGATQSDVSVVLTASDVLARMPATRLLFERGVFSWGHVRALVSGVRRLDRASRDALDEHLGEHGEQLGRMDPQQRLWALDDAIQAHAPEANVAQREAQELDDTFLVLSPRLDGSGSAYGEFDPESFTTVTQALDREADTPQGDRSPGDDDSGMPKHLRQQPTTRARQVGQALVRLCGRGGPAGGGAPGDGAAGGTDPVTGWAGTSATAGTPGAAGSAGSLGASAATGPTRTTVIVDLDRITDLTAATLQPAIAGRAPRITRRALDRLSCDAAMDLVVTRGHDLLAAKRYAPDVTAATRRAVLARDGGCRFPGCTAPASWAEIHHVHERARGGDHRPSNLVSLCRRHHQVVHRKGWEQVLRRDGSYTLRRRGRSWTTLPRREHQLPPPAPDPNDPVRRQDRGPDVGQGRVDSAPVAASLVGSALPF